MSKWILYSSGIPYANLYLENGQVEHEQLDDVTAASQPRRPLSEEDNNFYKGLTNFDILYLMGRLDSFGQALAKGEDTVLMPSGEKYQKDGQWNYCQREVRFPKNILFANGKVRGFTCPSRERVHVLVEDGCQEMTVISKWEKAYPDGHIHPLEDLGEFDVAMRDQVTLSTTVMLPADRKGPVPTVLVRTPYGKEGDKLIYKRYVHRGYGVVLQDVRGRNKSGGEWMPDCHEVEDGDDTLNWIAAQPWSNGKVGTIGGSYLGYVQWAAAASGNPHLCAMVSVVCAGSAFGDIPRKGGAFVSGMLAWAFAVSKQEFKPELMLRDDWDEVLNIRPLEDIPRKALGYEIPFLTEWLKHMDYDDLWRSGNWSERSVKPRIPALIMSGWFDDDGMGTTEALDLTAGYPENMRKIILGPWQHGGNSRYDLHGVPLGNNALMLDIDLTFLKWFDFHLKGEENGADMMPPVQYYTLGDNQWKTAENWPVPETRLHTFYLTSGGNANTSSGDGRLSDEPLEDGTDSYYYDPENPALCVIDMSENEVGVPENYTEQDLRQDVLCYDTEPLEEELTLTGDFTAELYISSDAPDTDFVVRINDVDEKGISTKLADGLLSARFRDGFTCSKMMEPGKVYRLVIRTSKLSATFKRGHKLRFTVTSSAKNWIFPNSNTEAGFNSTVTRVACNKIHHGKIYPSKLVGRREVK